MWSDSEDGEFIESGKHCAGCGHQSEGCEVTLLFTEVTPLSQFKTQLFVCGNELTKHCRYFEGLLLGGFKENNEKEANVHDVSRSEMVFFLEYAMHPKRPLPLGKDTLCTLIKVSDLIICASVHRRIAELLNTESFFFDAPAETKLELIKAADQHRGCSWDILDACIRFCTNLHPDDHSLMDDAVSPGTKAAVKALGVQLRQKLSDMSRMETQHKHLCERNPFTAPKMKKYDIKPTEACFGVLRADRADMLSWYCCKCEKTERFMDAITLEKFKQFEIDRTLLRD